MRDFVAIRCIGPLCVPRFSVKDADKTTKQTVSFLKHEYGKPLEDGWKMIDGKAICPKCQDKVSRQRR